MKFMQDKLIYILDTHVLIWYFLGSKRLRKDLKERIDKTRLNRGRLLVPTIVLAEALDIAEKERVGFDFSKLYQLIQEEPEFEIVDFGSQIFDEVRQVKKVQEIHDRIIVATAKFYGAGVLAKDRIIRDSGEVEII